MKPSTNIKKCIATRLAVTIFFILLMVASERTAAQNLVVNPGFTNGTTGWTTQCSIEINPESVYGGIGSNPVTEIDVERCMNQEVSITAGTIYDFGFKASRRQGGTPATVGVTVTITGIPSGAQYVNTNYTYTNTGWAYTVESGSFIIPANSTDTKVNIRFSNYVTPGTYGTLIDDISLQTAALQSILPVKLISFKAEEKNNTAVLDWSATNDDNDGRYFIIERAGNGGFDSIGIVAVSAKTGVQQYSFVDHLGAAGVNSYRLKIVNMAGFSYSNIVRLENNKIPNVQLYPNPATSSVSFKMNSANAGTLSIQVYSVAGTLLMQKKQLLDAGVNNVSLDITSLQRGSFYVKISGDNGMHHAQSFCKR